MKKNYTLKTAFKLSIVLGFAAIAGTSILINACKKGDRHDCMRHDNTPNNSAVVTNQTPAPVVQNNGLSQIVTVAHLQAATDQPYTNVFFNENEQVFVVKDPAVIAQLQDAYDKQQTIKVTYDPWAGILLSVDNITTAERNSHTSRQIVTGTSIYSQAVNLATVDPETINTGAAMAVINTTTTNLTNVIPDFATAQMMFDYITHQCCQIPGPYAIDHCIPFQYCPDGCYARAHKMCWIINNRYNYQTHKIFSFANAGSDRLSVKCEKWGGCCVTWWYHVAPLVNIKTPQGVKAYVFDPAMFDQPVPLATWLHAQENPACAATPHVSMINIQPTSSYSPSSYSGYSFDTDPTYSATNSTLISYGPLHTCP